MATSNLRFRIIGEDDASSAFLKVAAAAKLTKSTLDDVGQSALGLTKLIGGAGLIPVAVGASAALVELTTSAAAGAGALGIFGLSVAGIGKDMIDSQTKIKTAQTKLDGLTKGTAEYKTALMDLHLQQQTFNKDFGPAAKGFNDMKMAFAGFKDATRGVTTNVMGKAFELLASVLPKLAPVANAAGKAVGGLIDDLSGWTKSSAFKGLLDWFKNSGPKAITHFGHAVGNILVGLGGILKNFVGPGDKAAKSLQELTKRFAEWGNSKGVSDSVDKFLKYVHDNGPGVATVLGSLAAILPKLASSFGGLGSVNLTVISAFLKLLAGMPQGVFDVVVQGLFGILVATRALNIVMGINVLITGMATALGVLGDAAIGTRIGLAALWVTEKVGAAVTKGLAAAQWLLNAALDANPIGVVVVALAALAVGLIYAYKHSETFRNIVNNTFHYVAVAGKWMWEHALKPAFAGIVNAFQAVAAAGKWLWNGVLQPVFQFIVGAVAAVMHGWALLLHALGHIPGFGWVNNIADDLDNAGNRAAALAQKIRDIPSTKSVDVIINVIKGVVHTTGGHVPAVGSGSGGAGGGAGEVGKSIGNDLMNGIMGGIAGKQLALQTALNMVAARIQNMGTKISNALSKISNLQGVRSGFAGTFTGTSIFGTDLSTITQNAAGEDVTHPGTIAAAIAFQKQQAAQARRLAHDVRKVTKEGLSKSLVRQLQSQGTAGAATLHALAQGSRADIRQLNRLNNQTVDSLRHAGMTAGNFVRGGSINEDIRHAVKQEHILERQEHTLERLEHHLKDIAQSQKKDQTIVVKIGEEAIITAIHRRNKRKGVKSAGV